MRQSGFVNVGAYFTNIRPLTSRWRLRISLPFTVLPLIE